MLLTEISLQANHLTTLQKFYEGVMNLPVSISDKNSLKIHAGNTVLIFEENKTRTNPYYHFAFNIPSNKFEEAFDWFKPKVSFLWLDEYKSYIADFQNWNAKSFYFYDPSGNILEIISRFELENVSEEKFSGSSICNISELGIVFPAETFESDVEEFMKQYSLSFFKKQPSLPTFKAAGDDQGLFIMVPYNRDWYPGTKKKSASFPLSVSFTTDRGRFSWESK
ncbi:MAG: hypothetical protein ABIN48_00845 [Ginsengibacter sp.]